MDPNEGKVNLISYLYLPSEFTSALVLCPETNEASHSLLGAYNVELRVLRLSLVSGWSRGKTRVLEFSQMQVKGTAVNRRANPKINFVRFS